MDNRKIPLLTIAIPTYNRKESILRQVKIILPQLTDEVCLLVIDNHSNEVVANFFSEEELNHFVVIRNEYNIGGDANIAKCFQMCKTKWLWTLSDDDFLKEDAISYVLYHLKESPDCVFLNFHYQINDTINGIDEFLKKCDVRLYSSLFWMSICVYNLEKLSNYMHYYFPALSTMQPGIVLLVRAMQNDASNYIKIIKSDLFQKKDDVYNITWSRSSFVYASLILFDLLRDLREKLNASLFVTITQECIEVSVWHYKLSKKKKDSLELLREICRRRGLCKVIRYNGRSFIKSFIFVLLGR